MDTAEGSTLYYSLLYVTDDAAQRVIDTLHFADSISTALHDVSEPSIAEKKIHWWHEELARLAKQEARHPAAVKVQPYLHHVLDVKASLALLSASSNERFTTLKTDEELEKSLIDEYGSRLSLLDSALNTSASKTTRHAVALGLGHFHRLNTLVPLLRSGYAVFSDERYAKHGLTPEQLLSYSNNATAAQPQETAEPDKNINALLAEAINESSSALKMANDTINGASEGEDISLPIQVMCQIRHSQLKLWQKRKPDLLSESINLTPLRKFFVAYQCKRRFTKALKKATN